MTGAQKTAAYRERHGAAYRERHATEQRLWRATPHGKRMKKNGSLLKLYGITLERFEEMARLQGGKCPLCASILDMGFDTAVDHDHETGEIRGILCSRCNRALGGFRDDPAILQRAIAYIAKEK